MQNPFEEIAARLDRIEAALKTQSQATAPPEPVFFTLKEVAVYLKLSPKTVYRKTSAGTIPYVKKNGKLYFVKKEIDRWIAE